MLSNLDFDVFIYCCGKSGSSTLYKTFLENGYKTIHVHNKNYYINYLPESKINSNIFDVIKMNSNNHKEIYIIDSYRTPIERKISSYFQLFNTENKTPDEIIKDLDKYIYSGENYVSINEVLDYFNLPRFKSFNFEKKYNLVKFNNINIIKLRFNDINEWGKILSEIFCKEIKLVNHNVSDYKNYKDSYRIVKSTYKLPKYMVSYVKNDIESKIYNTPEELNEYINYWESRTREYLNVPPDFDPVNYINLNQDLRELNFDEIKAYDHYENYGYNENRIYKLDNKSSFIYNKRNSNMKKWLFVFDKFRTYENYGYNQNRKYKLNNKCSFIYNEQNTNRKKWLLIFNK